jgi:hypothetical protein
MGRFALLLGEIDERLIGNRLDEAISQQIQRKAQRPDRLRLWNSLLNLIVRKSSVWTNSTIIYERPTRNHFGSVSDRNVRIAEVALWALMADAYFRDLGRGT